MSEPIHVTTLASLLAEGKARMISLRVPVRILDAEGKPTGEIVERVVEVPEIAVILPLPKAEGKAT